MKLIDEEIKKAYMELSPSEDCHRRIMERAASFDKTKELKKRIGFLSRAGYAVAACLIVSATAFLMASGMFNNDRFGAYYNGNAISDEYVLAEVSSVDYTANAVSFSSRSVLEEKTLKKASAAVELELYGNHASASVSAGSILIYDGQTNEYVNSGSATAFTEKAKIVWSLPEERDGTYELTVKTDEELYTLVASYDAKSKKVSLKTK